MKPERPPSPDRKTTSRERFYQAPREAARQETLADLRLTYTIERVDGSKVGDMHVCIDKTAQLPPEFGPHNYTVIKELWLESTLGRINILELPRIPAFRVAMHRQLDSYADTDHRNGWLIQYQLAIIPHLGDIRSLTTLLHELGHGEQMTSARLSEILEGYARSTQSFTLDNFASKRRGLEATLKTNPKLFARLNVPPEIINQIAALTEGYHHNYGDLQLDSFTINRYQNTINALYEDRLRQCLGFSVASVEHFFAEAKRTNQPWSAVVEFCAQHGLDIEATQVFKPSSDNTLEPITGAEKIEQLHTYLAKAMGDGLLNDPFYIQSCELDHHTIHWSVRIPMYSGQSATIIDLAFHTTISPEDTADLQSKIHQAAQRHAAAEQQYAAALEKRQQLAAAFTTLIEPFGDRLNDLASWPTRFLEQDATARAKQWIKKIQQTTGIDLAIPVVAGSAPTLANMDLTECIDRKLAVEYLKLKDGRPLSPKRQLDLNLGTYGASRKEMARRYGRTAHASKSEDDQK